MGKIPFVTVSSGGNTVKRKVDKYSKGAGVTLGKYVYLATLY